MLDKKYYDMKKWKIKEEKKIDKKVMILKVRKGVRFKKDMLKID